MQRPFRLTLHPEVATETTSEATCLKTKFAELTLPSLSGALEQALALLSGPGAAGSQLEQIARAAGGPLEALRLDSMLEAIDGAAMLCRTAGPENDPWATLTPCGPGFRFAAPPAVPGVSYCLSRFALLRRAEAVLVLESPLTPARVVVRNWRAAAAIAMLAKPSCAAQLHAAIPGAELEDVEALLLLLEGTEMAGRTGVSIEDAAGLLSEDERPDLIPWEVHDLFFHSRSRSGRHDAPVGGTFRFQNRSISVPVARPPVTKDRMRGERVTLYRPQDAVRSPGPGCELPLWQILEMRRSFRRFGDRPITLRQLGEFLFRSLRAIEANPDGDWPKRLYPSAGACYEIECYLAVRECMGLAAGLYHYQPAGHDLTRLTAPGEDVAGLLRDAWRAAGMETYPQILIVLAARFARVAVKYESISYALVLKNTGVVIETMQLVATSLGLAGCPIGCGNSDLFARAAGLNYYEEGSVGEFLLGSLP